MKKTLFLCVLLFSMSALFAQTPIKIMDGEIDYLFNERLSRREALFLRNGGTLCNSIGNIRYSRIKEIPETQSLIAAIKEVNPNHLAEIIKILPYNGYEELTHIVSDMLKNEESYTKVPFSIDDYGRIEYLYSDAKIESIVRQSPSKEVIVERFLMKPLDYFTGRIEDEKRGTYIFYRMKNSNQVRYKSFFSAIGKEKMIAVISIFRYGDNWIIYGLGGVDIIKLPFVDRKIDSAFYKRIKAFCVFTFERLELLRSGDEGI